MNCLFCSNEFTEHESCPVHGVCKSCCDVQNLVRDCEYCKNTQIEMLQEKIKELEEKLRFIPVSEKFPEKEGFYEVQYRSGNFDVHWVGRECRSLWESSDIIGWRKVPVL